MIFRQIQFTPSYCWSKGVARESISPFVYCARFSAMAYWKRKHISVGLAIYIWQQVETGDVSNTHGLLFSSPTWCQVCALYQLCCQLPCYHNRGGWGGVIVAPDRPTLEKILLQVDMTLLCHMYVPFNLKPKDQEGDTWLIDMLNTSTQLDLLSTLYTSCSHTVWKTSDLPNVSLSHISIIPLFM